MEPTNQAVVLNLATIRLTSTNKAVADAARFTLENIPANSPMHPVALRYLAADAAARKSYDQAVAYSQAIVGSPAATYTDKIAHLQLLYEAKSPEFPAWRATLEEEAKRAPFHAYALGRWMAMAESPSNALVWLRSLPPTVQTNLPVPLIVTDCQIALADWRGLLAIVERRDWDDAEYYRLSLESLANRHLDETLAAKNDWERAFDLASHRLDRLTRLAQITLSWGWKPECKQVLQEIVLEFPKEQWALDDLISWLYTNGDSAGLADLLSRVYSTNPSDNRLKNNLANISLLRKSDLQTAFRLAREAYDSAPQNPFYISTYAYSLLLQNKAEEAVKVLGGIKAEDPQKSVHRRLLRHSGSPSRPQGCCQGTP